MEDKEAIEMMQRCVHELRSLRSQNLDLAPKADAFDVIKAITFAMAPNRRGYSEDLVWVLEKRIRELQPKPKETE
jgi:hypothetical protein